MVWIKISGTCEGGPCPRLYLNLKGDARLQGYLIEWTPPEEIPSGEGIVHIPAADLRKILSGLPVEMLECALLAARDRVRLAERLSVR